jgi:hypothetical protein
VSRSAHSCLRRESRVVTKEILMSVMFFLECHNVKCIRPIWLPTGQHLEQPCDQPWPPDGLRRNFACPTCGEVSSYSPSDCLKVAEQQSELILDFSQKSLVCIEMTCCQKGCSSPFLIHAVGSSVLATAPASLANATAVNAVCERGHTQNGAIGPLSIFFARPVFDWAL